MLFESSCNKESFISEFPFSVLHTRLGYTSTQKLLHIPGLNAKNENDFQCLMCPLAKHYRMPFSSCQTNINALFELVYMDLWGPYPVQSITGARYFLIVVDDCSNTTWTFMMQQKSQCPSFIANFFLYGSQSVWHFC